MVVFINLNNLFIIFSETSDVDDDLTRFCFCNTKITFSQRVHYISIRSAASNLLNFAIWQKKILTVKQEAEINQICNFPETSDDDDEADDGEGMTEIRFAPDDKATLQVMFSSMSHCQTLHPDPEAAEDAADEEAENDEVRSMFIRAGLL